MEASRRGFHFVEGLGLGGLGSGLGSDLEILALNVAPHLFRMRVRVDEKADEDIGGESNHRFVD